MRPVGWHLALCLGFSLVVCPVAVMGPGRATEAGGVAGTAAGDASRTLVVGATTRPATSQPLLEGKTETIEHDFGAAWAGDAIRHTFEVANTTDHTLAVHGVSTGCGCTTTGNWEKEIRPGQVWRLDASLDTAGRMGPLRKGVVVKTDDPGRAEILLVLKGEVQPRFEFCPADGVVFGTSQTGAAVKRTVSITNRFTEPVTLIAARPTTTFLKAQLRELEKGQRYELDVETVPPLSQSGSLGNIVLETDLKEQPKVTVPVHVVIRPRVYLSPKTIFVPVPVAADTERTIQVVTGDGVRVNVIDVEMPDRGIRAILDEQADRRAQRIKLRIAAGTELSAQGQAVTVYTDDAEFPKLRCELRAFKFSKSGASQPSGSHPVGARSGRDGIGLAKPVPGATSTRPS